MEAAFRRRVHANESIEQVHGQFIRLAQPWFKAWNVDIQPISLAPTVEFDCLSAHVSTNFTQGDGLISLDYVFRKEGWNRDEAYHDDVLSINFPNLDSYRQFITDAMMSLGTAFGAYRGRIVTDGQLVGEDWDAIATAVRNSTSDVDGRDTVYRFHPVMLFDRELCERAFEMTPSEVARKAEEFSALVSVSGDRVLIAASLEPLDRQGILAHDSRMKHALGLSEEIGNSGHLP